MRDIPWLRLFVWYVEVEAMLRGLDNFLYNQVQESRVARRQFLNQV